MLTAAGNATLGQTQVDADLAMACLIRSRQAGYRAGRRLAEVDYSSLPLTGRSSQWMHNEAEGVVSGGAYPAAAISRPDF